MGIDLRALMFLVPSKRRAYAEVLPFHSVDRNRLTYRVLRRQRCRAAPAECSSRDYFLGHGDPGPGRYPPTLCDRNDGVWQPATTQLFLEYLHPATASVSNPGLVVGVPRGTAKSTAAADGKH